MPVANRNAVSCFVHVEDIGSILLLGVIGATVKLVLIMNLDTVKCEYYKH